MTRLCPASALCRAAVLNGCLLDDPPVLLAAHAEHLAMRDRQDAMTEIQDAK